LYLIFGENACKTDVVILSSYSTLYRLIKCGMICRELVADMDTLPFFGLILTHSLVCVFGVLDLDSASRCGKINIVVGLTLENC
jgi:hypothetical protein